MYNFRPEDETVHVRPVGVVNDTILFLSLFPENSGLLPVGASADGVIP